MVYPRIPIELERISWVCGISKLESQLQNWGLFKNSRSSDHYALDQRSWDCYINLQTHDISIECGVNRFSWQRYAWCDDGVCIEKASQHAITFPKKSKCRWAANSDTFLQGRQIAHMIFECFSATETCEVVQRLSTVFAASLQSANVRQMGSSLSVSEMPSWKDCTGQNWRILFNFRLCWQYMINKHKGEWSTIENRCETSCWSDDDNSKLYSPECCCGKGISQRKLSLRWEESGRAFSVKVHGQCSKGDSCSFSHDTQDSGNRGQSQRRKRRSSSLASRSKVRTDRLQ